MAPRILLIAGDASEDLEVMYSLQRLQEAGYTVEVATKRGKQIQLAVHDFEPTSDAYVEHQGRKLSANIALHDVKTGNYAALVVPGGRAPEYLRNDANVKKIVQEFNNANKPIAHICHGGQILATAGVLKGRKISSYPELASDLETYGAKFFNEEVIVDENQVSSRTWVDHPAWMREVMKLFTKVAPV